MKQWLFCPKGGVCGPAREILSGEEGERVRDWRSRIVYPGEVIKHSRVDFCCYTGSLGQSLLLLVEFSWQPSTLKEKRVWLLPLEVNLPCVLPLPSFPPQQLPWASMSSFLQTFLKVGARLFLYKMFALFSSYMLGRRTRSAPKSICLLVF